MISVDASALVIMALVFALVLILGRLFFEPLAQAMESRRRQIVGARELWDGTAQAIEEIEATRRDAIQQARVSGYERLDAARAEAQAGSQRRLDEERRRLRQEIENARSKLRGQGEQAVRDLETQADRLAAEIASRVLGREVA